MAQAQDTVWLPVLPSMKGFGPALIKGTEAEADKSGKSVGMRFGKALMIGTAAVGAGALAAGTALYKLGEVFDDVADTIRVGTGATGDDLDGLIDVAKRVGSNVPAEFEAVGSTVADVNTRMGLSGETLELVASQYLEAGRILGEDVDIMKTGAAFNAFGIEGEAVSGALDHLFQVSQATGIGMNELADGVARNAPAIQTLGFSFEESAVMIGQFDKAGLNSGAIMASMSKGLVTLAKDGENPQKAFKRVVGEIDGFIKKGDEAGALKLASKVFGTKGATQMMGALKSGTLNLEDMSKAAGQTEDTILGAGRETMDFAEHWQMFKNKIMVWLEPLATKVFGAMGTAMDVVNQSVTAFGAAWESNDGEITSSGIPGFMEKLGYWARQTFDYFQSTVVPMLQRSGEWIQKNSGWLSTLAVFVGGMVAGYYAWIGVTKLWTTVTTIANTAQKLLNGSMKANPIGVLVMLIGGLVAAVIWLYKNNETARQIIDGAWNGIKSAVQWAWNVIKVVFNAIVGFVTTALPSAFLWLRDSVIKPVWSGITGAVKGSWTATKVLFQAIVTFIRTVLSLAFTWLRDSVVKPVWTGISGAVSGAWSGIKSIFTAIRDFLRNTLGPVFTWLRDNVIKPVFNGIKSNIDNVWKNGIKPIFDIIAKVLKGDFTGAFQTAKDAVGRIWSGIANVVRKPINFVIKTVYNDGIKKVFDKVGGVVGLDPMPRVDPIPAFAKGGQMGKGWKLVGEEGPELINTGPGFVYTARQTMRMLAGKQQMPMAAINQPMNPIQAHEGIGGFGDSVWGGIKGAASAVGGGLKKVWDKGSEWVLGGLAKLAQPAIDLVKGSLSGALGTKGFGGWISGIAGKLLDNSLSFLKKKDSEAPSDDGGGSFGGSYDGALGRFFRPGGRITSGFGASRGRYPHAGIDFAVPIGTAIKAMFDGVVQRASWNAVSGRTGKGMLLGHGKGMQSYYGHLNGWVAKPGQKVKAGETIAKSGNTGRSTGPHLHAELWRGGKPFNFTSYLYDNGGIVPPGLRTIENKSRKPETLYSHTQNRSLQILASRGASASLPKSLTLRVGEREFTAYLDEATDNNLARHVAGLEQQQRQHAGVRT